MEKSFENYDPANDENIHSPYADTHLPPGLEDKAVQQLRQNNLLSQQHWYQSTWMKTAAVLIVFAGGFLLGRQVNHNSVAASVSLNKYLLLLYNSQNFTPDNAQQVSEYSAWLKDLRKDGTLADGDELKDIGWTMVMNNRKIDMNSGPVRGANGTVGGYFIIKAPSEEKALTIASTCPHLKYNGVIEVREIQKHGN
ncbi:MAG TPA: YciI family protein [Chitinophagaceae bacterium]|nr:YciI family protein [Chitinophagaceae bacterium]